MEKIVVNLETEEIQTVPYTQEDIDSLPTQNEVDLYNLSMQIQEAKDYLLLTDHKFLNGYKQKVDEDLVAIEAQRDSYRDFIRNNS